MNEGMHASACALDCICFIQNQYLWITPIYLIFHYFASAQNQLNLHKKSPTTCPGSWALGGGEIYYSALVSSGTTSNKSATRP